MDRKDIINLRKKTGLSQERFAARLNVSRITVANWERGYSEPSPLAQDKLELLKNEVIDAS